MIHLTKVLKLKKKLFHNVVETLSIHPSTKWTMRGLSRSILSKDSQVKLSKKKNSIFSILNYT